MKKINSFVIAIVCVATALIGCSMGKGGVTNGKDSDANVKKEVKIGKFDKVNASTGIKIVFTQGRNPGVAKIATTSSAEPYLEVFVKDGELCARYKQHNKNINGSSIVTVSSPELEEVEMSSGATFTAKSDISLAKDFEVSLSSGASAYFNKIGSSKIDFELSSGSKAEVKSVDCAKFSGEVSSAADLSVLKVLAVNLEAEASSGSKIKVGSFDGTKLITEASSGATVTVGGIKSVRIEAEATSGAKVELSGVCSTLDKESSSGGRVEAVRLVTDCKLSGGKKSGERGLRKP